MHKAMIQWFAASFAELDVVYLPYDAAARAAAPLATLRAHFASRTVGALYAALVDYGVARAAAAAAASERQAPSFVDFMLQQ